MLESFRGHELQYKKLSPEEMKQRSILGRLVGPICDTKAATRNGRAYSRELWEKALNDELFLEKLNNKCLFAELGHPDRTEVDMREACAALAEQPKLGDDGLIYGVWDILDTPNGNILKTFCDYGTTIGISSRGEGDVEEDFNGNEIVDPESYALETFDIVILPAMKKARLKSVNEALDSKKYNKTLRQRLNEALDNASTNDREIMKKTLDRMNIKLNEDINMLPGYDHDSYDNGYQENEFDKVEDKSNILEFPNGEYFYIEKQGDKLVAGHATNTGLMPKYEIEWDNDCDYDCNVQKLYDQIVSESPELLDESLGDGFEKEISQHNKNKRWLHSKEGHDAYVKAKKENPDLDPDIFAAENAPNKDESLEEAKEKPAVLKGEDPAELAAEGEASEEDNRELDEATSFDGLIYARKLGKVMKDSGKSDEQIAEVLRFSGMEENEIKDTLAMLNMKDESYNEALDTSNDIDFDCRQSLVSNIYHTIGKWLDMAHLQGLDPSKKDIESAIEEAIVHLEEEPGLEEDCNKNESCNEELANYKNIDKEDADYFDTQISKICNELLTMAQEADYAGLKVASQTLEKALDVIEINGNELTEECNSEDCADKDEKESEVVQESVEAVDNSSMVEELQKAIKANKDLEEKLMNLQSEKAVSDAKVEKINEELDKYKELSSNLSLISKESRSQAKKLSEELESKKKEISKAKEIGSKKLNESIENRKKVKSLDESLKSLNESLKSKDEEITKLNEQLNDVNTDLSIKTKDFNKKIERQTKLTEAYKKVANNLMESYIKSKAILVGVNPNEIKNRLDNSYSLEDVDRICEDLQSYKLQINGLPFNVTQKTKLKFTESKKDYLRQTDLGDEIDDQLLEMAGMK